MRVFRRSFKTSSVAIITGLIILIIVSPLVALAVEPHEDPQTAETVFSGISLFRYYAASLDFVLTKSPEEVKARLEKMPFANIPQSIGQATDDFALSGISLASLTVAIDEDLSKLRSLAGQFRFDEVAQLAAETSAKLRRAEAVLRDVEQATVTTGSQLKVPSAPPGSDLKVSYDEVMARIEKLKELLALDRRMLEDLKIQAEKLLKPAEITFKIEPAVVGDNISFEGVLTSEGKPLADREIVVLLNSSKYITVKTDASGYYAGILSVPHWYLPELDLQALYYPRDKDVGFYLAALSPVIKVKVLFYEARLEVTLETKAYPGLETVVNGSFDYGQSPPLKERRVEIYLDDALITGVVVRETFTAKIKVAPEMDVGEHIVTLSASSAGRYAPVTASAVLNVTRAVPILDMEIPKVAVIPGSVQLSGKLYSEVGRLSGASIKMRLGQSGVELVSSENGTFDGKIKMGMGLGLIGSQDLETEVVPREPWHAPLKTTGSVLVVNWVSSVGFLAIVAFLGIYLPSRLRRRFREYPGRIERPAITMTVPEPAPTYSQQLTVPISAEPSDETSREPRNRILYWYRLMVRLLQGMTKALLGPQQTLREFANQSSKVLGPFARYFIELTRMVERLLYSPHRPSEEDVEKSEQLAHNIEGVFKSEGV